MAITIPAIQGRHSELQRIEWQATGTTQFDNVPGYTFFHNEQFVFWAPSVQRMWVDGRLLSANEYWGVQGETVRWKNAWTSIQNSREAQELRGGNFEQPGDDMVDDPIDDPIGGDAPGMVSPGPDFPGFPGDDDFPAGGGQVAAGITAISVLGPRIPAVWAILRGTGASMTLGRIISWSSLGGLIKTALIFLGLTEGFDILVDMDGPGPDTGIIGGFGGGQGDPIGQMVEAMTVSTWDANGVKFHRLSDGRLAVRNKHGVWKIWRPKKPVVIMPTGQNSMVDILRADRILQNQAKKIQKLLRNRGWKVSRS